MAGVNRFMQPAEAQFINTYVPIPFDDMMKVGLLKQARIDEDTTNEANMIAKVGGIPTVGSADAALLEQKKEQLKKDIANLPGQPGFQEHKQGIANLMAQYVSDPDIKNMVSNAKPYAELQANVQKGRETNVPEQNMYDVQSKINEYNSIGAKGFREKYGSGQLGVSSYTGYTNIREGLKKWSADVKPTSEEAQYIDQKTGQYKVTEKNSEITVGAILRPYGVTFDKNYVNGKLTISVNKDSFDRDGLVKIMNSQEGAQIKMDAAANLRENGEAVNDQNMYRETRNIALSTINSIVQEKVHKDSSIKFDAEDYAMARYKNDLTDKGDSFTYSMYIDSKGNSLTNTVAVDAAKTDLMNSLKGITDKKEAIGAEHGGVTERKETSIGEDGKPFTRTFYDGADGKDATEEMLGAINEENSFKQQQADIEAVEIKLKGIAKLPANYVPLPGTVQKAETAARNAVETLEHPLQEGYDLYKDKDQKMSPGEQKVYDDAYRRSIEKSDPKWAKYNSLLAAQAKAGLIEVGVSRFPSEKLNTTVEEDGLRYYTENKQGILGGGIGAIEWAQTGDKESFSNKDYENINNGLMPRFMGTAFDVGGDGELKFIYKFQTAKSTKENPEYMDAVKVPAPDGAAAMLIRAGKFTPAEQYLTKILSNDALGVDKANEAVKMPGFDKKYSISFETLDDTDKITSPSGSEYRIIIPVIEDGKVTGERKYTVSKQEAITKIIGYYKAVDALKNKRSGPTTQ